MPMQPAVQSGGDHGPRLHALLNFWGLVLGPTVGALLGAVAVLYVNVRRERFESETTQLRQRFEAETGQLREQLRALEKVKATAAPESPRPTPHLAELENQRLRADLEKLKAQAEASGNRAAQLESELNSVKQQLAAVATRNESTPGPEIKATKANAHAEAPSTLPPRQKLERFTVEVPRAQASRDGSATIYVTFTSTVGTRIKMLLAGGFLDRGNTFLVDDLGQYYDAEKASGIGTCCFGFAGGDWRGSVLELPPKGSAEVTLSFRRRGRYGETVPERPPQTFTLTSELTLGDVVQVQGWHSPQWRGTSEASIRLGGINVR